MQGTISQEKGQTRDSRHLPTKGYGVCLAREDRVSEKLKRILLKEPGDKDSVAAQERNRVREQPAGESDSAAGVTDCYKDNVHGYYISSSRQHSQHHNHSSQHQWLHQQRQRPEHWQQERYENATGSHVNQQLQPQELSSPETKRFSDSVQIKDYAQNQHSSDPDVSQRVAPRVMSTPSPQSNSISRYNGYADTKERTQTVSIMEKSADSKTEIPLPNGRHSELYPMNSFTGQSRSPHMRRRQLPASPSNRNHYETIEEVRSQTPTVSGSAGRKAEQQTGNAKGEQASAQTRSRQENIEQARAMRLNNLGRPEQTSQQNKSNTLRNSGNFEELHNKPEPKHRNQQMNLVISPDAQYETASRRASMPAVGYNRMQYEPISSRGSQKSAPCNRPLRKGENEDAGYVYSSENEEDSPSCNSDTHERSGTPVLPAMLLGDDVDELVMYEPTYKNQRSLSAAAKLVTDVQQFQSRLRASGDNNLAQLVEESDEQTEETTDLSTGAIKKNLINADSRNKRLNQTGHIPQRNKDDNNYRIGQRHNFTSKKRLSVGTLTAETNERTSSQQTNNQLDNKVDRLERMYEDISNYLHASKPHKHRDTRRHSIASASSSQYSYSHRHRKSRSSEAKSIQRRFQRLESHIVTLAKSVAHLSTEISDKNSMFGELDRISTELEKVKQHIGSSGGNASQPNFTSQLECKGDNLLREDNLQKISRLTRFKSSLKKRLFGQEPPLMKIFLKQLGYEKYQPLFNAEHIGMLELPYMSEERLRTLGIPLGPRVRILQEAKQLCCPSTLPIPKAKQPTSFL
ncbi:uncharacterized protein [Watersipora subatra]|uniref:uncharacterized protein n=1 Tax=Watersipora subatra TaxID=2589382 RepID=UPI00355BB4D5